MSAWSYAFGFAVYVAGTVACYLVFGHESKYYYYLPYFLLPVIFWTDEVYGHGKDLVVWASESIPWAWLRWERVKAVKTPAKKK